MVQNLNHSFMDNFRFKVILGNVIPDFSPLQSLCPSSCDESLPILLERICCSVSTNSPINIQDVLKESPSSRVFTDWLTSTFWLPGLKIVFQAQEDSQDNFIGVTRELVELINNFHTNSSDEEEAPQRMNKTLNLENSLADLSESEVCGYVSGGRDEKILGGTEVGQLGHHPWQLSLGKLYNGTLYQHNCGASVLSRTWALTAAHCVESVNKNQDLYVMGGFLEIEKLDTAQIRLVDEYMYHEDFHTVLYEQDIALLHLSEPFVFTPHLLPVCLPAPGSDHEDKTAVLIGWGRQLEYGPPAKQLMMVELPVISNSDCEEWWNSTGSLQWIPDTTFVCAGQRNGSKDACSGDSGGPLNVVREDGRVEQIGLVSWGIGCGSPGRPGVYTRISEFIDWIDNVIREYEENVENEG